MEIIYGSEVDHLTEVIWSILTIKLSRRGAYYVDSFHLSDRVIKHGRVYLHLVVSDL